MKIAKNKTLEIFSYLNYIGTQLRLPRIRKFLIHVKEHQNMNIFVFSFNLIKAEECVLGTVFLHSKMGLITFLVNDKMTITC